MSAEPQYKSPVETTSSVRSYVKNLVAWLQANPLSKENETERVDIGALLNDIAKVAGDYSAKLKKQLNFGKFIEIDGTVSRARLSESENSSIPPDVYYEELDDTDFFADVKVSMTAAKARLTEERLNEIKVIGTPTKKISFQLKVK